jgi:ABC-type transport system substrate-binding protein
MARCCRIWAAVVKSSPMIRGSARPLCADCAYQLRQDVGFHDGSALTAEDVVFSYKRARESSTWSELLNGIRGIQTPDSYTVVFTLSRDMVRASTHFPPANLDLHGLYPQIWTLPIVPARVYQSDPKRFITNPVGCGPFIAELNLLGNPGIVQLKAFEQYYLGTPRLQNLSIALQPDINVLIQRLVAGELNAIVLPDTEDVELAEKLKSLEDKYQIIRTTRGKEEWYMCRIDRYVNGCQTTMKLIGMHTYGTSRGV